MTTQITIEDYWSGRDTLYAKDLTDAIRKNAEDTVSKVNLLLFHATKDGIVLIAANRRSLVASGWRPPEVNAAVKGSAVHSHHMTGEACDVSDPTGSLDKWCEANRGELEAIGLWQESPASTQGWCHLQTVKYGSYKPGMTRIFIP